MVVMTTSHARLPAPAGAEHLVDHVWVMRAPGGTEPWHALLVPNGRPSVVVSLGEPGERIDVVDRTRTPNAASVAGVRRVPAVIEQRGEAWYVGARLRPYGLAALGLRDLLVDDAAPLEALAPAGIDPAELTATLRDAPDDDAAARALAHRLAAAAPAGAGSRLAHDRVTMVDRATATLDARRGLVTAVDLARSVGVPQTILDTAVGELVGVGLDDFMAMTRFHHFVGGPGGPHQGPAALGVLRRYRVEGRAPRETLRFTGLPPARFVEVRDAVAAVLAPSASPTPAG